MNIQNRKVRRQKRTRAKVQGTKERPRLTVFRSNKYMYAQLINDNKGETLIYVSEKNFKTGNKTDRARHVGLEIAKQALGQKIKKVVFDKGSYAYHGRVKAAAEGARGGGLEF